jgi:hypothetical protein
LGDSTRHVRRLSLDGICEGKTASGAYLAELRFTRVESKNIREIRDVKAGLSLGVIW